MKNKLNAFCFWIQIATVALSNSVLMANKFNSDKRIADGCVSIEVRAETVTSHMILESVLENR